MSSTMTFLEELRLRGLLQDHTPGIGSLLEKEQVKAYIGYDPTAPSLTIGNLVTIMLLVHLQRHGHIPMVLFGGATGRIGDPSGKDAERKMLDIAVIEENLERQRRQFDHILRFGNTQNQAVLTNNYDWFRDMGFLDFLREAGKHITISYMMGKESVKRRIETGISFTEFSYQLLQGYDYYHLYTRHGVKLQMGGSDQWGNITTGTELIRRKTGGEAHAITCPLLTKADGTKFGKSEGQNIWLDPDMTSPYRFYQFFINATDEDAPRFFKIFSTRPIREIEEIIATNTQNPNVIKQLLAADITEFVHGLDAVGQAREMSRVLFGKASTDELARMDAAMVVEAFDGLPIHPVGHETLAQGIDIVDLLSVITNICTSKSDARRSIQGQAISINKNKISDPLSPVGPDDFINGRFLLVQNGKKHHHLVVLDHPGQYKE
jgi:tyrosyl-tRNA synthetase